MSALIWMPSPNFGSREDTEIDTIVCHITDGQPNVERAAEGLCKLDPDPKKRKSAHFVTGQLGERFQLVSISKSAWHASGYNKRSIGIEHVARTPDEFKNWSSLPLSLRRKLVVDVEATADRDPGIALTEAQLAASAQLVAWLLRRFRLPLTAVIPHCRVPGTTHLDCGRDQKDGGIWPWDLYRELVQNEQKALESVEDLDSFAPLGAVR